MSLASAAAIFDEVGCVLLVRENYGQRRWGLPGGVVEPDESPWSAVEREVREETDIHFSAAWVVATYFVSGRAAGLRFVFAGRATGNAVITRPSEIAELGWFDPTSLPTPMTDTGPLGVRDALAGRRGHFEMVSRA